MLLATLLAGAVILNVVTDRAVQHKAAATALVIQELVGPVAGELAVSDRLSPDAIAHLERILDSPSYRQRFPHFEIWKPGGRIAYSRAPQLVGRTFPLPRSAHLAFQGEVAAEYTDLRAPEHLMRAFVAPYLEIYSPIRKPGGEQIVAVAEIHEETEPFREEMAHLRLMTWLIVGSSTGAIMLGLFGIVRRASRTLEEQAASLAERMAESQRMADLHHHLKERAQAASARVAEVNEAFVRSVGAELHDGPAQLIGFSLLKVGELARTGMSGEQRRQLDQLKTALEEALNEVRSTSRGLLLPDIATLSVNDLILRAVRTHEKRTATSVALAVSPIRSALAPAVKACIFRFVQEGLNNAVRHGAGLGQRVEGLEKDGFLSVSVVNAGPAGGAGTPSPAEGLGLFGLRDRIESLGGSLTIAFDQPREARITMTLELTGATLAE